MAYHSLIEQALMDINEQEPDSDPDFSNTVSYKLLQNLVTSQISSSQPGKKFYQFKIQVCEPDGEVYEALLSEEHEA